jgi:magnesium-transporting ATPase (P-type)
MVSGDHLLTTMSIAKDCGLMNKAQKVFIGEMEK